MCRLRIFLGFITLLTLTGCASFQETQYLAKIDAIYDRINRLERDDAALRNDIESLKNLLNNSPQTQSNNSLQDTPPPIQTPKDNSDQKENVKETESDRRKVPVQFSATTKKGNGVVGRHTVLMDCAGNTGGISKLT